MVHTALDGRELLTIVPDRPTRISMCEVLEVDNSRRQAAVDKGGGDPGRKLSVS